MPTPAFRFIHDLFPLSERERAQYLADLSAYIKLPPELNGLDIIDMNDEESGGRKLVAYARRGTCEVLRDIHGINVERTVESPVKVPGAVVFQSEGTNAKGRREVAVGSHFIDGLSGKLLSDAVMTAHTRSLRRLTLQFVCAGLLDESEIKGMPILNHNKAALAELAAPVEQPTVEPTSAPGKDVTEKEVFGPDGMGVPASVVEAKTEAATKPKRKYNKRNTVDLGSSTVTTTAPTSVTVTVDPTKPHPSLAMIPMSPQIPAVPQNPPALPPVKCLECGEDLNKHQLINSARVCAKNAESAKSPFTTGARISDRTETSSVVDNAWKEKYVKRLSGMSLALETEGGMQPSIGVGGAIRKLRKFAALQSGAPDIESMDADQWEEFFEFANEYTAAHGLKGLTAYVNKALGVS